MPRKELAGKRFGKLTVIQATDRREFETIVWECKCDCGQTAFQRTNNLTTGTVTSCGCGSRASRFKPIDITGQRFGMLTAVRATEERKETYVLWECLCDCGNTVFKTYLQLKKSKMSK